MQKTKILAIAPYEGLKEILMEEALVFEGVELDVYLGDLAEGAMIATSLEHNGYDVILSRGGTALMIEERAMLPVIDIAPSANDLIRFIRLAKNIPGKFAFVAYTNITSLAADLLDLIGSDASVVTLSAPEEAEPAIQKLQAEGCTLLIGDAIAVATAKKFRMNSILVASGSESVRQALNEALRITQWVSESKGKTELYKSILEKSDLNISAYSKDKTLLFSNLSDDQMNYQRVFRPLPEYVPAVLEQGEFKLTRQTKGFIFNVSGRQLNYGGDECAVFYIKKRPLTTSLKDGLLSYYHVLDNAQLLPFLRPIDNIGAMASVMKHAASLGRNKGMILISGEQGSPFDAVVFAIHHQSRLSSNSLVMINCDVMDDKALDWLLDNEESPLFDMQLSICFKALTSLNEEQLLRFMRHVNRTVLHSQNQLMICLNSPSPMHDRIMSHYNSQDSLLLNIPALRQRPQDIPGLANLYLSALNIELGKQVLGFDGVARTVLTSYEWPGNNDQLYRFVKQCLLSCNNTLIAADDVINGINQERASFASASPTAFPIQGTLYDINKQIVRAVLKEENMNRQQAAERLGISRSTIWRMTREETNEA